MKFSSIQGSSSPILNQISASSLAPDSLDNGDTCKNIPESSLSLNALLGSSRGLTGCGTLERSRGRVGLTGHGGIRRGRGARSGSSVRGRVLVLERIEILERHIGYGSVRKHRLLDRCVASLEIGPEDQTKLLYPRGTAVATFDFVGVVKERRS